jgi:membrane protease YdiL (CAAX protease family)
MQALKSERPDKDSVAAKEVIAAARLSLRAVTALEIASVIISVLVTVWAIVPMRLNHRWLELVPGMLALALMINSHRLRGETLRELGFTAQYFGRALLLMLLPMLIGSALLIGIGYWAGSLNFDSRFWARIAFLPWWGLLQQYVLQAFIYRRLRFIFVTEQAGTAERAKRTRIAILTAGALFALVHAPNLTLVVVTLVAGVIWSWVYERAPNLFALGLSHGVMSALTMASLPSWLLQSMSIGYNHFFYHQF